MAGWSWKGGGRPPATATRGSRRDDEPFELHNELLDAILRETRSIKTAVWWLVAFVVIGFVAALLVMLLSYSPTTP